MRHLFIEEGLLLSILGNKFEESQVNNGCFIKNRFDGRVRFRSDF